LNIEYKDLKPKKILSPLYYHKCTQLYPNEIAQFQIWDAPNSVQQKSRSKVEASHQKREQSKQLLEIAKTGVERAIETDESTPTTWINQQLEALEVKLT
jgi:type I restriction enzyme M protein